MDNLPRIGADRGGITAGELPTAAGLRGARAWSREPRGTVRFRNVRGDTVWCLRDRGAEGCLVWPSHWRETVAGELVRTITS